MVDERGIGAAALGDAGGRRLPGEMSGPRPGEGFSARAEAERRETAIRDAPRAARAGRP